MVQGTASGVGKSVLAAAFCRLFARTGYRVAPFKAQNMALNSAVAADGGEIGRAQAAQAEAAGVEATVDMNPILLKPETDERAQVVVRGVPVASCGFNEYRAMQPRLLETVGASLERLRRRHDLVVIEGAGSPAEINLRDADIANMAIARMADARVLLVGDVERGGVFAALVGTMTLLDPIDRGRVGGLIINKLRGDRSLLAEGLNELSALTGVPVLGVVPWVRERLVPAEDSLDLDAAAPSAGACAIDVAVVRLPRIANFDEFEPLAREPGVGVRFVRTGLDAAGADLIVVPGTKTTIADLAWLRETGLAETLAEAARRGRLVLGIRGGFQMLGSRVNDPAGVESPLATADGLGLLPVVTTFEPGKTTVRVDAIVTAPSGLFGAARGLSVSGYEIHSGRTELGDARRPFAIVQRQGTPVQEPDGAINPRGNVIGTYLHGLFANAAFRGAVLRALAERKGVRADPRWGTPRSRVEDYDRLADLVSASVDVAAVANLVGLRDPTFSSPDQNR